MFNELLLPDNDFRRLLMSKIKLLIASIGVSGVLFLLPVLGLGQTAEPNYEMTLHMLMGSNEATSKANLPSNLSAISQQLKSKVGYSNFRLAGTIIGRMANNGNFQYNSYSDLFGEDPKFRSFIDVTIAGLKGGTTDSRPGVFQFQTLRFGAKVPVIVGYRKDDSGRDQPTVSYENIGLTLSKIGISEDVPTLVGTLDVPNGTDMIFLVITVKTLDR